MVKGGVSSFYLCVIYQAPVGKCVLCIRELSYVSRSFFCTVTESEPKIGTRAVSRLPLSVGSQSVCCWVRMLPDQADAGLTALATTSLSSNTSIFTPGVALLRSTFQPNDYTTTQVSTSAVAAATSGPNAASEPQQSHSLHVPCAHDTSRGCITRMTRVVTRATLWISMSAGW